MSDPLARQLIRCSPVTGYDAIFFLFGAVFGAAFAWAVCLSIPVIEYGQHNVSLGERAAQGVPMKEEVLMGRRADAN